MSIKPKQSKGTNKGWANLRPAKPGECRNPHGRPLKEFCITDWLRKVGAEKIEMGKINGKPIYGEMSNYEALARTAYALAAQGNMDAIKFVTDRLEGKAVQPLTGDLNVNATLSMSESQARMNGHPIPKAAG